MQSTGEGGKLRRDIGRIGLLFSAVGSIIGSGWLFGALNAAEIAGPASIFAWAIGALLILFIGLTYAELGTMLPLSGGVIRYPHFAFGSFASYTLGWITWLSAASVTSIEVVAALTYANNYLPGLQADNGTLTGIGFIAALGLLGLFSLINVIGVRWFVRFNNLLVWWKLAVILVVIVTFFWAAFSPEHFHTTVEGGWMPFGWNGVFSSVATAGIVFSFLGFRQGVELAGETKDPQRSVPFAIIGSILITLIIYMALQITFIGALPHIALSGGWENLGSNLGAQIEQMAQSAPLATLASVLALSWLALLIYVDAFISPADTGLIFATVTTRLSYAMGKNTNAPKSLAKVNKRGVPWVSVILTFVAGTVFLLPFPSWQQLVGFVTAAVVLSFGSGPLALLAMRKQLPAKKRPYFLPWANVFCFLAFWSSNLIVFWSGWDKVWKIMVAILIGYVVLALHEWRYSNKTPKLELKSGSWVIFWLTGLTIISYLGNFPTLEHQAGNLGLLKLGGSFVVLGIFSIIIMWIAIAFRLPASTTKSHLEDVEGLLRTDETLDGGY